MSLSASESVQTVLDTSSLMTASEDSRLPCSNRVCVKHKHITKVSTLVSTLLKIIKSMKTNFSKKLSVACKHSCPHLEQKKKREWKIACRVSQEQPGENWRCFQLTPLTIFCTFHFLYPNPKTGSEIATSWSPIDASENWELATRISRLVPSRRQTFSVVSAQGIKSKNFTLDFNKKLNHCLVKVFNLHRK